MFNLLSMNIMPANIADILADCSIKLPIMKKTCSCCFMQIANAERAQYQISAAHPVNVKPKE